MTQLYLRIWLAVAAAVAVVTIVLAVGGRVLLEQERRERSEAQQRNSNPSWFSRRDWVLRDAKGEELGRANEPPQRIRGSGWALRIDTRSGETLTLMMSPRDRASDQGARSNEVLRPPDAGLPAWMRSSSALLFMVVLLGLAVALGAYPVARRITQRLEALQRSVARWGSGDLSTRVVVRGRDEIAYLAQQFNDSAERIEQLVAAHKHLLANASHELRSPLARLRMAFELHDIAPSDAVRAEIRRSMGELDQLIDEVLLASRMESKAMEPFTPQMLDLTALAAEECARLKIELNAQSLELAAEAKHLRRALRNLLENAQRYGGASVLCSVQRIGDWAEIRIEDAGPGVSLAERETIFEPFYRAAGASERSGGVGLGLALVRSIAHRHGGSVQCVDRPLGVSGACFVLRLPLNVAGRSRDGAQG